MIVQTNTNSYSIPGMKISIAWNETGDRPLIKGQATTSGWVAIGFNQEEGIIGADLKMLAIQNDQLISSDRKILVFADYPADTSHGGSNGIFDAQGVITNGKFDFSFTIDSNSADALDQNLTQSPQLWITLAYSQGPACEHHSRIRKHFKFELPD